MGEPQGWALIDLFWVKCSPLTSQMCRGRQGHIGRCHVDKGWVNSSQKERVLANNPTDVQHNSMAATVCMVMLSTGMLVRILEIRKEELWFSTPPFLLLEQSQQVFIESCSLGIFLNKSFW